VLFFEVPYTRARDEMLMATDTAWAPWFIARSDDKRWARLSIIKHLLANIPYKNVPRTKVRLPERRIAAADQVPKFPLKIIPNEH
jgi:polyphosphate kinase